MRRYAVVPALLVIGLISALWLTDSLQLPESPVEALFTANSLWVLFIGPIVLAALAAATRAAIRARRLPLAHFSSSPRFDDPRRLAWLALMISLGLSVYFFLALASVAWWAPIGIDSPGPGLGMPAVAVLLPADLLAAWLVVLFALVLRRVLSASDASPGVVGRELVAAYAAALVGCVPPALLALLALGVSNGWGM